MKVKPRGRENGPKLLSSINKTKMKCPHCRNSELFSYHRWTACHLSQEGLARNWLCLKPGVSLMSRCLVLPTEPFSFSRGALAL